MANQTQQINEIKRELKNLSSMVENTVRNIAKEGNGYSPNVIGFDPNDLKRMAHNAGQTVRSYLHDTTEQAAHLRDNTQARIVANPLKSVAIAAAAGLVLGALFKRRY